MNLFFRKLGSGEPVIILHGLYGSSDNWYTIGRALSESREVYLLDQRNHGNSPHVPEMNYEVMSRDLNEFMDQQHIKNAVIIGHSMGGKTALSFGLAYPERVTKMIVVDISPLDYNRHKESNESKLHRKIITGLANISLETLKSRAEADQQLAGIMPLVSVRQFLLKNLKRTKDGKFEWALNIKAISDNVPFIFGGNIRESETDPGTIPHFPILFIRGELSGYIKPHDEKMIHYYFPWAKIKKITDAGHWVHAEQPEAFLEAVKTFLDNQGSTPQ